MKNAPVFDRTVQLVQDRLSLISLSQRLASGNIANINTPRYVAKQLSFQDALSEENLQLTSSDSHHITPEVSSTTYLHGKIEDTGPVDLEQEMMKLTKNSVEYQYMVAMLNKKFALLRHVVTEGGN